MHRLRVCIGVTLIAAMYSMICCSNARAHQRTESVDWKAELEKAQQKLAENPQSAFWHSQAGAAYDALGDTERAVGEFKLASGLAPHNSIYNYELYAIYKRKGAAAEEKRALQCALERDSSNPFGHYELGVLLESEKRWQGALNEYRQAKALVSKVKQGDEYIDSHQNPFSVDYIRVDVDNAIERVTKGHASAARADR